MEEDALSGQCLATLRLQRLVPRVESGDGLTLGGRWAERWAVQKLPLQIHSWDMLQTNKRIWMIKRTAEIKNILNSWITYHMKSQKYTRRILPAGSIP